MNRKHVPVAAAAAMIIGMMLAPEVASAQDGTGDTLTTLEEVTSTAEAGGPTAVLDDVAPINATAGEDLVATVGDTEIVVPSDPADPLRVGDLVVMLDAAVEGDDATQLTAGVIEYRTSDGVSTVPVIKDDGSLQIVTVIPDASSPTEYGYDFTLPAGGQISEIDGVIAITDAAGEFLGGVAPAWAVDATGSSVPTRYEVRGTTLVQVVEHSDEFAYPVTADPYLGANLFSQVGYYNDGTFNHRANKGKFVRAIPSAWGRAAQVGGVPPYGWGNGQAILRGYGWVEIANRVPAVRNLSTIRQQYDCHVLGAYPGTRGGGAWDLESGRANRPNWLADGGAWYHQCNWP